MGVWEEDKGLEGRKRSVDEGNGRMGVTSNGSIPINRRGLYDGHCVCRMANPQPQANQRYKQSKYCIHGQLLGHLSPLAGRLFGVLWIVCG